MNTQNCQSTNQKLVVDLWKYASPVMLTIGLTGNLLSIVIFSKRNTRNPLNQKFLVLAVTDLTIVSFFFPSNWMMNAYKLSIYNLNNISCKLMMWLVETALQFSSLIMADITLDRLYSVWKPLSTWTSKRRIRGAKKLLCMLIVLMIINSHLLYGFEIVSKEANSTTSVADVWCTIGDSKYHRFYTYFGVWFDLSLIFYFPYLVIIISNVLIFAKLKGFFRENIYPDLQKNSGFNTFQTASSNMKMILALNIVFVLTTCPRSLTIISYYLLKLAGKELCPVIVAGDIALVFMYNNNCFNFLFYLISSQQFRKEFRAQFRMSQKKSLSSVSVSTLDVDPVVLSKVTINPT